MFAQAPVKAKVFFVTLMLAAAGLVAADFVPRAKMVDLAPQPGVPAGRDVDTTPQPRECDPARGVDTVCVF